MIVKWDRVCPQGFELKKADNQKTWTYDITTTVWKITDCYVFFVPLVNALKKGNGASTDSGIFTIMIFGL